MAGYISWQKKCFMNRTTPYPDSSWVSVCCLGASFFPKECLITCKIWKHLNRKINFSFHLPCTDWNIQEPRGGNILIENNLKAL